MIKMKIEKFKIEYYDEVVELWRKAGVEVVSSDTIDEVTRVLNRNPDLFLIGKVQEKIIAVVIGAFDGRRGYVHHLAVDPDYQKVGLGKTIMEALIEQFRTKNIQKVHLFIEKSNKSVIEFYTNLGWDVREDLIMMSYIPDKKLYKRHM
ncbi:MAG: GNAT family N-acetyltransferase [Promethearchaeota archaeon]|nr:MAG: GNAT family N-acetyltransferase [Candidatus Lokiarchaeota archaeon]